LPKPLTEINDSRVSTIQSNVAFQNIKQKVIETAGSPKTNDQQDQFQPRIIVKNDSSSRKKDNKQEHDAFSDNPSTMFQITHGITVIIRTDIS
jgi:hypothetical protein